MTLIPLRGLRVEETPLIQAGPDVPEAIPQAAQKLVAAVPVAERTADEWRRLAIQTGERLSYAENQLKDLRTAADEARARFGKYKSRSDAANARVNDLQIQLVSACAERDALRTQLAQQDVLARKVHDYRQSLLSGPLWELFAELAVCPPDRAGEKVTP